MAEEAIVYVELEGDDDTPWAAVVATRVRDNVYRLPDTVPEGEEWAYPPGSIVVVAEREFPDGPALVVMGLAG